MLSAALAILSEAKNLVRIRLLLLTIAAVAACSPEPQTDNGDYQNVMAFDSARVRLVGPRDTLQLSVELALSAEQKSMGLMERRTLGPTSGMLFVYDSTQPPTAGFWMFRTRIPLDIAFIDSTGVIRAVRSMTPCQSEMSASCPTYTPDVPYQYALETNPGLLAQHGIAVGHTAVLSDLTTAKARPNR